MANMEISSAGAMNLYPKSASETAYAASAAPEDSDDVLLAGLEQDGEDRSLAEMIKEAKEKADEQRERLKLPKNTRYGDAPLEAYARLNRARTQADVSAAAGYARRRISQLRTAKQQDKENADRIQAAINQLQKAVSRAGKKKRDLEREHLMDVRRVKLEREARLREAQRTKQELIRRKTMRVIRESGYISEAEIDNHLQTQLAATRMELQAQAQALTASTSASLSAATQQYAAAQATAAPPPPAAEVNVQA